MMEHDKVKKRMYTCMCNWVTMLYSRKKICIGEIKNKKEEDEGQKYKIKFNKW